MSLSIVISFFGVLGFSRLLEPQVLKKESVNREVSLCRRDLSGFINVKKCLKDSSGKMYTGVLKRGLSKRVNNELCNFCYAHPKKITAA